MSRVLHDIALFNGRLVSCREPILALGHAGVFTGWGVFTTLRVYDSVPFAFERHWDRLARDAGQLNVEMPPDRDELRFRLIELVKRNQCREARMRLNIVRAAPGLWTPPRQGQQSDVVAFTAALTPGPETAALTLQADGRHARTPFAGTKTLSWAHNLTLYENAARAGYADALLLNELGEVSECTSANVFAVKDGVTLTPPLSSGALPGVTREVMLGELDDAVRESILRTGDIHEADEVFITSSTRELVPVDRLDQRPLGSGTWPVMERLRVRLREYIRAYVESARA